MKLKSKTQICFERALSDEDEDVCFFFFNYVVDPGKAKTLAGHDRGQG